MSEEPTKDEGHEADESTVQEKSGESGRATRDMHSVTDVVEERPTIDIRLLDKAIDKLLKVRGMDTVTKPTSTTLTPVDAESVKYFMEKTGETKISSENFLGISNNNLKEAFVTWLQTTTTSSKDYDSLFC